MYTLFSLNLCVILHVYQGFLIILIINSHATYLVKHAAVIFLVSIFFHFCTHSPALHKTINCWNFLVSSFIFFFYFIFVQFLA